MQTPLLKRLLANNDLVFDKGQVSILGIYGQFFPLNTLIFLQRAMKEHMGKQCDDLHYQLGRMQSRGGGEIMFKKFGFPKTKQNAELQNQQGEFVGVGRQEYIKFDLKNKHFIVKIKNTPFARQYLKLYGLQKEPVDHFLRGLVTGANEAISQTDLIGIETQCIAMGKPACIIEVKEKSKWDLSNPLVKTQFPQEVISSSELEKKGNLLSLMKPQK